VPNVPFAIAADQAGAWLVTNLGVKAVDGARPDGSVAELSAATGRLVRNIGGAPFRSSVPGGAIAAGGGAVWVTGSNFYGYRHWLAELSAATGGGAVWVTGSNFYGYRHWLAELSAATGALVRVIAG
jgi:hypothetical protein